MDMEVIEETTENVHQVQLLPPLWKGADDLPAIGSLSLDTSHLYCSKTWRPFVPYCTAIAIALPRVFLVFLLIFINEKELKMEISLSKRSQFQWNTVIHLDIGQEKWWGEYLFLSHLQWGSRTEIATWDLNQCEIPLNIPHVLGAHGFIKVEPLPFFLSHSFFSIAQN